jgi:hypothetical protein
MMNRGHIVLSTKSHQHMRATVRAASMKIYETILGKKSRDIP